MEKQNQNQSQKVRLQKQKEQLRNAKIIRALIVMEAKTGLNDIAASGVILNAEISTELLENIFTKNRPLHDGAVILNLEANRIKAAGCLLPLSNDRTLSSEFGTRHRAGLGMSEKSDALTIIVSEETGETACALRGRIFNDLDETMLEKMMYDCFVSENEERTDSQAEMSSAGTTEIVYGETESKSESES